MGLFIILKKISLFKNFYFTVFIKFFSPFNFNFNLNLVIKKSSNYYMYILLNTF
jgi:hypothetical protein